MAIYNMVSFTSVAIYNMVSFTSVAIYSLVILIISSNFPSDMFIHAIVFVMLICCVVFVTMWYLLKKDGYPVKGLVE